MAHIVGLKLPELLREKSTDVKAALLTPVLMTWDERVKFATAPELGTQLGLFGELGELQEAAD